VQTKYTSYNSYEQKRNPYQATNYVQQKNYAEISSSVKTESTNNSAQTFLKKKNSMESGQKSYN
jgi:hypothetical protein